MVHRSSNQITTELLRHEANLQTFAGQPEKQLRAWQRACAFLQAHLPQLKFAEASLLDSSLRLLSCCESCAAGLKQQHIQVLQHQATLQYHFVRLLHDRKDFKLVLEHGLGLSYSLQQDKQQPWAEQLQQSCMTAVVSATYHEALSPSHFAQCASGINDVTSCEASQLARNLILAHMGHRGTQQLTDTEALAAYALLARPGAPMKDAERVFARLAHSCSDSAMECLMQAMLARTCATTYTCIWKIALSECVRRSSMFKSYSESCHLIRILFVAQAALAEPSCASFNFLPGLSHMLHKMRDGACSDSSALALEVSVISATATIAGTTATVSGAAVTTAAGQQVGACLQLILQAARVLCGLARSSTGGAAVSQLSCAISAASAVLLACCQRQSSMSARELMTVHHEGQQIVDTALEASEAIPEALASLPGSTNVLLGSLRCAAAVLNTAHLCLVPQHVHSQLSTPSLGMHGVEHTQGKSTG